MKEAARDLFIVTIVLPVTCAVIMIVGFGVIVRDGYRSIRRRFVRRAH
jgi:hypothetical protein